MKCFCGFSIDKVDSLHKHINECMHLKQNFGQIYQVLGQYHTKTMQMPRSSPQQNQFASILKSMLKMFVSDLNQTLGIPEEE